MEEKNNNQNQNPDKNVYCVLKGDGRFPKRLRDIANPPQQLYVRGELPDFSKKTVAIIGAREASVYGRQMAYEYAKALAAEDVQIISGMAKGIDAAGHEGALAAGKKTYAVFGCGVDVCYPAQNRYLYNQIAKQGGLISEYPLGTSPRTWYFPMRNRIISGLADLILVIEAKIKSGALITADLALEQGKDVFAMPGRVTDCLSEGCHHLIAQGAGIAWNVEEIFFALFGQGYSKNKRVSSYNNSSENKVENRKNFFSGLARDEKSVYSCMSLQPKHVNELLTETGMELQQLLSVLLSLELKGIVRENTKNYYIVNQSFINM